MKKTEELDKMSIEEKIQYCLENNLIIAKTIKKDTKDLNFDAVISFNEFNQSKMYDYNKKLIFSQDGINEFLKIITSIAIHELNNSNLTNKEKDNTFKKFIDNLGLSYFKID